MPDWQFFLLCGAMLGAVSSWGLAWLAQLLRENHHPKHRTAPRAVLPQPEQFTLPLTLDEIPTLPLPVVHLEGKRMVVWPWTHTRAYDTKVDGVCLLCEGPVQRKGARWQ